MHFQIRYKVEFLGTALEGALIVARRYECSLSLKLCCSKELFSFISATFESRGWDRIYSHALPVHRGIKLACAERCLFSCLLFALFFLLVCH